MASVGMRRRMRFWWRSRRVPIVALVGVGSLLVPSLSSSAVWWAPAALGGGASAIDLRTLGLLAWSGVIVYALAGRGRGPEARPVRHLAWRDGLAVVTATMLLGFAGAAMTDGSPWQVLGRSLLAGGLAGIAAAIAGARRGVVAVTLAFLVTFSWGHRLPAASFVRVLEAEANPVWALACGVLAMVAAVACLLRWDRPPLAD